MSSLLERKLQNSSSDNLTFEDLHALSELSNNALYAQVKRALKEGYLIRLRKGAYRRGKYLEKTKAHPFEMAHAILWPSYISLESALSFHSLIPEAVYSTTCVTTKRSTTFENAFGFFMYHKVPKKNFLLGVTREVENNSVFFMASPWKAITDYVYCYKKNWKNHLPLLESLRMDLNILPPLETVFAKELSQYYQSKRVDIFLEGILENHK